MSLRLLANGTWLDMKSITRIRVIGATVEIDFANGKIEEIVCDTVAVAETIAASMAAAI